jgi:hydrogenase nickel incorporation protein HypA/HybF
MHEMSLTEGLIELIEGERARQGFSSVRVVRLAIGALGHVEPEAMRFCFDAVARGTVAEGARLEIRTVPGEAWCLDCGKPVRVMERFGACPDCGQDRLQVASGDELRLEELEVD